MKRKHFLLIAALSLSLTTTAAAATLSACGDDEEETKYVQVTESVTGTYYFDDNGSEKTIVFGINSFTLNFGDGEKEGFYESFENGSISMVFDNAETASATFDSGLVRLSYKGNTYTLYLKRDFTVSFNTDNGTAVAPQTVRNGRMATCPENPERGGDAFVDWYTDPNFASGTAWNFESMRVTGDITLYAKFVTIDKTLNQYQGQFDLGAGIDEDYGTLETVNRRFYRFPAAPDKDGNKFLGWWTSSTYDRNNLSSKYDNQEVFEDTVFYAVWESDTPVISVTSEGARWWAKNADAFDVTVKNPHGFVVKEQHGSASSIEFDFKAASAGDYTVEVTANGKTGRAIYKNKALARVTKYQIDKEDDNFLGFAAIDTEHDQVAVTYYLDFECGSETHSHTHQKLIGEGFDFSNCLIKEGGFRFRITAEAEDYAASVSEWFTLDRKLDAVTELTVNGEREELTWKAVDNAKSYDLEFSLADGTKKEEIVTGTSYDLRPLGRGEWTIKVTPVNPTYLAPEAARLSYNKQRLVSPENIKVTNTAVTWDAVAGATGYALYVNGTAKAPKLTTNSYTITEPFKDGDKITVVALGASEAENSLASDPVMIHGALEIAYADGYVSWNPVLGMTKYGVKVGDGAETFVEDGSNRARVTFTHSGENVITVTGYDDTTSTPVTASVTAYEISFDTDGGSACDKRYHAEGDTVILPEAPTRTGHTFLGWFNQAENGTKYGGGSYRFNGTQDTTVYANWKANEYTVTLVVGAGGTMEGETEFKVTYGERFRFPVPTCNDETKDFAGWFTAEQSGTGYTDNVGQSQSGWNMPNDYTLYAHWDNAGILYQLRPDGTGYTAMSGSGINGLSTVTVRATYKGLPVLDLGANAFSGCGSLKKLLLPSSLRTVVTGNNPYGVGSSFYGLDGLTEIEVYDAGGDSYFTAVDDCLYTLANGEIDELVFVAGKAGRTGTLTVADGTKRLAPNVLSYANALNEVVIPASVTFIAEEAFASMAGLTTMNFLPAANGQLGKPLEIRTNAFRNCDKLTEIIFPKRLATITPDVFGDSKFGNIKNLQKIYIEELGENKDKTLNYYDTDGVLCKGDEIIYCPKGYAGSFISPTGVKKIRESAFGGCKGLTSVTIGPMIEEIGAGAFSGCTGLKTLIFDQSTDNEDLVIGENAFNGAGITQVILPPNLKKLGTKAFACTGLKTVTINSNRDGIEYADGAFTNVTTVTLGNEVHAFNLASVFGINLKTVNVDEANPHFVKEGGTIFNSDKSQVLFTTEASESKFRINVSSINAELFKKNSNIVELTIGKDVTEIGASAFEGCTLLEKIIFEDGGTQPLKIGDKAFYGLTKLKTIDFNGRDGAEITIGNEAFAFANAIKGNEVESIKLPEGVTTIGKFAFAYNKALKSIELPASLTSIDMIQKGDKYPATTALSSVAVPNVSIFKSTIVNFETIKVAEGNPNFASKDGILYGKENGEITTLLFVPAKNEGAAMPEDATKKGYLKIPLSIKKVADFAFFNSVITKVEFEKGDRGESFALGNTPFNGAKTSVLVLPDGMKAIGDSCFNGLSNLTSITIPDTVTSIGKQAFYNCKVLTAIDIPNSVTYIGEQAFKGCAILETLTFATGNDTAALKIDANAFDGCAKMKGDTEDTENPKLVFPKRLQEIGKQAFQKCNAVITVEIPVGVTTVGQQSFTGCTGLETVTFTGEVTAETEGMLIDRNAFSSCAKLKSVTLPANLETLQAQAFGSTAITELTIPARTETVGILGTKKLEKLTFATVEEGGKQVSHVTTFNTNVNQKLEALETVVGFEYTQIKELQSSAFFGTLISSIKLPASLEKIGASAFNSCKNLTSIEFAEDENGFSNVNFIHNWAFKDSGLTSFTFPKLKEGSITVGNELFIGCNLETLTISSSVTNPGSALLGVKANNIIADEGAGVRVINDFVLVLTSAENNTYQVISFNGKLALDANGVLDFGKLLPSDAGTISEIAAGVFANQEEIKGIVIPESVEIIGASTFSHCANLAAVTFTGTSRLNTIGAKAFEYTGNIESVVLPDTVNTIGANAFAYSGIKAVTMPAELTSVGREIFSNCKGLTTVNNLSKMTLSATKDVLDGWRMFYQCDALKNVTLASGADTLPSHVFRSCTALEKIDLTGITSFADYYDTKVRTAEEIFYGCSSLTEVVLDGNLRNLPAEMFRDAALLTTVYRSDTAEGDRVAGKADLSQITAFTAGEYINSGAFNGCTSLTEVDIRNTTSMGPEGTFYGCTSLAKVTIAGAGYTTFANETFYGCTALKTVNYWNGTAIVGDENVVTIPDCIEFAGLKTFMNSGVEKAVISLGMKVIGKDATTAVSSSSSFQSQLFRGCSALTEVVLPATLTGIGDYVFEGCVALNKVAYKGAEVSGDAYFALPESLTELGSFCFSGCTVTELNFAKDIAIGTSAFNGCTSLTTLGLPNATSIGNSAFNGCTSLGTISLPKAITIGNSAFNGCTNLTGAVSLPEATTVYGNAFKGCSGITGIDLPMATMLGDSCFEGCSQLAAVSVPVVESVGSYCFSKCIALETIDISSATSVGTQGSSSNGTFYGCEKLSSVTLNDDLEALSSGTFARCTSLKTITLPSNLRATNSYTFYASGLTSITLNSKLRFLGTTGEAGGSVFLDCADLETVVFSTELTFIGESSFQNCVKLSSFTVELDKATQEPKAINIRNVGKNAFNGCTSLPAFAFGTFGENDGTPTLGEDAFRNCSQLASMSLPSKLASIPANAFNGCAALTALEIPEGVTSIGAGAFDGCNTLVITVAEGNGAFHVDEQGRLVDGSGTVYFTPAAPTEGGDPAPEA